MLFVLWIIDGFEELGVAPNATNVFWGAVPFAFNTKRIPATFLGLQTPLKENLMFPAIAEVVLV